MTTVQWQQIKSILTVALECDSESERLEFVAVSCRGDIALKAELDALLAQRDHTRCNESFLLELRATLLNAFTPTGEELVVDDASSSENFPKLF